MEAAGAIRSLPAQLRARNFERECEALRPLGEAYLLRRFGNSLDRADAEDAVAEVLIRLHRRAEEGRHPDNLRAAFFTSVRNAAIDQLRSRAAKPTVGLELVAEAPAPQSTPEESAEGHDDALRLREAIGRMRPNYREAIVLRFGLGLTVPEIAEHLQISLPAAKKLVLRATAQVRKRMESIEGAEFCPEMRDLARRSLFDKEAIGLADAQETRILRAHFEHCGSCRTFLASLHDNLHELGSSALLAGVATGHTGALHWLGHAAHGVQAGAAKLRLVAFKAGGALQPDGAGTAGALAGTGQKIAAICTAGAATATCLATGLVGPGIGAVASTPSTSRHLDRPAHVRPLEPQTTTASAPVAQPSVAELPGPSSQAQATPKREARLQSQSRPATSKASAAASEQGEAEFGFEGGAETSTATTSSSPATASSTSAPTTSPSPTPLSSGAGAKSGTEKFGFGG